MKKPNNKKSALMSKSYYKQSMQKMFFKLTKFFFLGLFVYGLLSFTLKDSAKAVESPAEQAERYECIGAALAEYLEAILQAKMNGDLGNIQILTPAFNMTSFTFGGIADAMIRNMSTSLDVWHARGALAGVAGNLYNTSNGTLSYHFNNSGYLSRFGSLDLFLTELGNNGSLANLGDTLRELYGANASIKAALLFNATRSNPDPNFAHHGLDDDEIREICSRLSSAGYDCRRIGINYANGFSGAGQYGALSTYNMGYALQIASAGNAQSVINAINSAPSDSSIIIRIGTALDGSGGFDSVQDYISFLRDVSAGITNSNVTIYAIGGPNEPDAEAWLAPECYFRCPDGTLMINELACGAGGGICVGPINYEMMTYKTTDIFPPFKIIIKSAELGNNVSDVRISDGIKSLKLAVTTTKFGQETGFDHTDRMAVIDRLAGSINPASDDYIERRADPFKCIGEENIDCKGAIPGMVLNTPGVNIPRAFNIAYQPPIGTYDPDESYLDYSKRLLSTDQTANGIKLGTKSNFVSPSFVACIQKDVCDPKTAGILRLVDDMGQTLTFNNLSNCLNADNTDPNAPPDQYFCSIDEENPDNCVGAGKQVLLTGNLEYIENPTVNANKLAFWRASSYMTMPPGFVQNPLARQDRGLSPLAPTGNLASELTLTEDKIAQNYRQKPDSVSEIQNPENDQEKEKVSVVKKAEAETLPPWGTSTCAGLGIVIENNQDEYYSVKIWDTNPAGCGTFSDAMYNVSYTLVLPNGNQVNAGGCTVYITGNNYPVRYDPNAGPGPALYGLPVTDWPGCHVTVSPSLGGTLQASISIPSSHAYSGIPGCTQRPTCGCDNDECRRITKKPLQRPINCSICSSWAPSQYCDDLTDIELKKENNCANGSCVSAPTDLKYVSSSYLKDYVTDVKDGLYTFKKLVDDVTQRIMVFFGLQAGNLANNVINGISCSIVQVPSPGCQDNDPNTTCELTQNFACGHSQAVFSVFGYVPQTKGNMEMYTTAIDMNIYNSLGYIPGVTDQYFQLRHTKHKAYLTLGLPDSDDVQLLDNPTECPPGTDFDNLDSNAVNSGNTCGSVDVMLAGGYTQSSYEIQFYSHYQAMSQHCLVQALLSLPNEFPLSQAEYCRYEIPNLRPSTATALLRERTNLPNYIRNIPLNDMDKFAGRPTVRDANGKTVAMIGPVLGERESNSLAGISGPQMSEKYESSLNNLSLRDGTVLTDANKVKQLNLGQADIKKIIAFDESALASEINKRMEIILNKYLDKYGIEKFAQIATSNDIPDELETDIIIMSNELKDKYGIL